MVDQEEADVVVIGSGMGGLAAARAITQFGGRRVLVLEQHYTLGGMTHEFSRGGRFEFGTGLHYMSADAGPFLGFMTDGRVQLNPLPDDYDALHFPGFDFTVPATKEKLRQRLAEQFPDETSAVDGFLKTVRRAMTGLAARNVLATVSPGGRGTGLLPRLFPATYRSVREQVELSFRDPRLRAIMAARWGLYGTPPESSAFGAHASVPLTFFMAGTAHPVGGPKELGRIVLEILSSYGVELRPRQRVNDIVVERGRVTGLDVEDTATGRRYHVRTGTVVSAAGVRNTYGLIGRDEDLAGLPAEPSALMLFLGMHKSPAEFGLRGENHWLMPDLEGRHQPPGEGTLYVSFASMNNPAARFHTVEVVELVDPRVVDEWRGTHDEERPESYRKLKAELTERLITRLDQRWPGFRSAIAFAELATPLSFETFQHSVKGSFYGLAATPQRLRSPHASARTPVKGLFVAGQDVWGPGVVGALAGGLLAAGAVLKGRQVGRMWRTVLSSSYPAPTPWQGYLRVTSVEDLSPTVRRIRLAPMQGSTMPFTFEAGQYLKVFVPVAVEPIERSYSICSFGGDGFVEIAVKREPDGLGSGFLHDELSAGLALRVSGPHGEFTWSGQLGDLLLIGGGIGITPLMSVLTAAAEAGHTGRIVLLVSFRTDDEVVFGPEVEALRSRLPGLEVSVVVTSRQGRINVNTLRPYAGPATRVHLCGPAAMMQDLIGALTELGVPRTAVHTEAFVSERSNETRREKAHAIALAAQVSSFTIGLGGGSFPCRPGESVLVAANEAEVDLPQSCGEGACGTCRVRVLDGSYETDTRGMFSDGELAEGWRLACQTLPTSDLTIAR
ncbi:2Fe-2S iron-sulfur cluster-binding protein [Paractinoplanes lichenicola]|uniref:2Fe-2S iron-sulfur cluster binding domain-containing protein n=1 Tax=Paractinoplanes lichenicola TaxID=2802976 RepID=A0ABS1VDJ5_9ACTN|nr:2Fe-2S iron-sulfur cluster-binding protein [Actinoplanes lichenicola]MBL7252754.1 2Fe-2S iron-sulfur cluster binding domain-containing protein [Actinoplanes lichenicola]